ncbi:RES family NAD+ phosphorylase [Aliiroseovarius sp. Z3]|uniref:RES family NAD+ phosphorylase n=1 Tax=Aliiroseovarius sp. Z3 TaxID=2811402 RepID=UPI0023B27F5B|nr:RES family NAD+ phosphorylase [Aliiroseovarius sp. Z3]MDE9452081.1 RES family NAD+ phosphorylase [Aliiroseovarius sp. Z3]
MIRASDLAQVEFTDPNTVRLISTAYIDEPAMAPLADDDDDLAILEEIEGLTSARRSVTLPIPGGLHPGELLTEAAGYGWTLVNAAFCYTRPTGNRFNGPDRGAWYASYGECAVETAQAEVSWHLTRELEATGVFDNLTSYRELFAGFTSQFHELAPDTDTDTAALHADPAVAYPAGQILARDVLGSDGNGILYPSSRLPDGQCLVALRPHLVQNVRQGATWDFVWDGDPAPVMTKR